MSPLSHLWLSGQRKGDEHPTYTALSSMAPFTFLPVICQATTWSAACGQRVDSRSKTYKTSNQCSFWWLHARECSGTDCSHCSCL